MSNSTEEKIRVKTKPCIFCGKPHYVWVRPSGYKAWRKGELIQSAMPELSKDERELLISGTCADCWDTEMYIAAED
jgi:hypothetical protein